MTIRPVGAELLFTDRQTHKTKLTVALRNFGKSARKHKNHNSMPHKNTHNTTRHTINSLQPDIKKLFRPLPMKQSLNTFSALTSFQNTTTLYVRIYLLQRSSVSLKE